jgi:hypothetical protein
VLKGLSIVLRVGVPGLDLIVLSRCLLIDVLSSASFFVS